MSERIEPLNDSRWWRRLWHTIQNRVDRFADRHHASDRWYR